MEVVPICDVCMKSPCDPRCPNAPDPKPVFICSGCGDDILDGDKVWHILGEQFCKDCIDDSEGTAEAIDEPY